MPTIEDLKDVFAAGAADAPRVDDLLAALPAEHRPHPYRRAGAITVGVAAAVAVAVVATSLGGTAPARKGTGSAAPKATAAHTSAPAFGRPKGPSPTVLRYSFRLGKVEGYQLSYFAVDATSQTATVAFASGGPKDVGDITVYSPGAFDPSRAQRHGTPLTVNGHRGYYANIIDPATAGPGYTGSKKTAVVWEYAGNAWAVVQGDWDYQIKHGFLHGNAEQIELRIARAVDTTTPTTMRLPMRLTYLPRGLVVQNAFATADQSWLGLTDGGPADPAMPADTAGYGDAVTVEADPYDLGPDLRNVDRNGNIYDPGQGGSWIRLGEPVHVKGVRAFQDAEGTVTMLFPLAPVKVYFSGTKPARISDAELLQIAQGLRVSSSADPSTWFDGRTVAP